MASSQVLFPSWTPLKLEATPQAFPSPAHSTAPPKGALGAKPPHLTGPLTERALCRGWAWGRGSSQHSPLTFHLSAQQQADHQLLSCPRPLTPFLWEESPQSLGQPWIPLPLSVLPLPEVSRSETYFYVHSSPQQPIPCPDLRALTVLGTNLGSSTSLQRAPPSPCACVCVCGGGWRGDDDGHFSAEEAETFPEAASRLLICSFIWPELAESQLSVWSGAGSVGS